MLDVYHTSLTSEQKESNFIELKNDYRYSLTINEVYITVENYFFADTTALNFTFFKLTHNRLIYNFKLETC